VQIVKHLLILAAGLTALLAPAVSSGAAHAAQPPGRVLYRTSWSNGIADWTAWSTGDGWRVKNGMLTTFIDRTGVLAAPLRVAPGASYALEVRFQVREVDIYYGLAQFGLVARGTVTPTHATGVFANLSVSFGLAQLVQGAMTTSDTGWLATGCCSTIPASKFDPGKTWHTARVEVRGDRFVFFIDGRHMSDVRSKAYWRGQQVGLEYDEERVQISSFTVTSL
jgi:hypothetical protein